MAVLIKDWTVMTVAMAVAIIVSIAWVGYFTNHDVLAALVAGPLTLVAIAYFSNKYEEATAIINSDSARRKDEREAEITDSLDKIYGAAAGTWDDETGDIQVMCYLFTPSPKQKSLFDPSDKTVCIRAAIVLDSIGESADLISKQTTITVPGNGEQVRCVFEGKARRPIASQHVKDCVTGCQIGVKVNRNNGNGIGFTGFISVKKRGAQNATT